MAGVDGSLLSKSVTCTTKRKSGFSVVLTYCTNLYGSWLPYHTLGFQYSRKLVLWSSFPSRNTNYHTLGSLKQVAKKQTNRTLVAASKIFEAVRLSRHFGKYWLKVTGVTENKLNLEVFWKLPMEESRNAPSPPRQPSKGRGSKHCKLLSTQPPFLSSLLDLHWQLWQKVTVKPAEP